MSRGSFMYLVDELRPHISPDQRSPNNRALTAEKKLGLTLYFLKDTGSIRMTANTFGVAVCTASMTVTEVCKAISSNLGPKYIYLPKDIESMRKKVSEFEANFGMTQAFGCVDGTHIPIKRPSENSQDYFCYKQYFSLNIQAVCDYRGFLMDVECKWPGSVHDAKVFANSSINAKLRDNKLPTTYQSPVSSGVKVPSYLIGDPAYPLLPFCMKEYDTCARDEQVIFNNLLRSARNPIECAFGRLKARWAILTRSMNFKLEEMPTIIYACFVLHNFCEKQNAYIDQDVVNSQVEVIKRNEAQFKNIPDPTYSYNEDEGNVIRKILTDIVLQNM
ncbi:protein ANTAGONIST OF LIKE HETEROCHROMATIN PROTEIN 1-like [Acropora millepora]|uniref:protein ANTAGONIST OF LIKE HETEROCHROMATIN PROTEIN 1-like n=4 Tax=Acropora TaxID=6127 RepID=UPI001CF5CF29|nr:protein ANTAGONIST OF LIKE HETEROCHROMATIN PROTEIN 1-like [Acropora millepora]